MDTVRGSQSHISFVVPVYQHTEALAELVSRVQAVAGRLGCVSEVILVDDASRNGVWPIVRNLRSDAPSVRVVRMPHNVGQHTAVLVGLREARGDWCVVLDQDLQDPPEAVAEWVQAPGNFDVVFGGRLGLYQPIGRTLSGRFYRSLLGSLVQVPNDAGMFFAIRREAVERLLDLRVATISMVAMIGLASLICHSSPTRRAISASTSYTSLRRIRAGLRMLRCVVEARLHLVREPVRRRIEILSGELELA